MSMLGHLADATPAGGVEFAAMLADPYTFHLDAYRRLGPVHRLRVGKQEMVVAAGPDVNDFVYRNSDLWDYPSMMTVFSDQFGDRYVTAMGGAEHQLKRRRLAKAFRASVLESGVARMAAVLERTLAAAADRGDPVDLRRLCNLLIFDQAAALLGVDMSEDAAEVFLAFEHRLLSRRLAGDDGVALRSRMFDELARVIDQKIAAPGDDPFSMVLVEDDGAPVSRDELMIDLALFFLAGTETTSHVILWSLVELARMPAWRAEVTDEVADWRISDRERLELPRTRATVLEAERRYPPLPFGLLLGYDDVDLLGHRVPRGIPIFHARTLTHFLDECYADPMRFLPERHLGRTYPARFQGLFGGGTHLCLGAPLARIQEALAVALVTRDWLIELVEDVPDRVRTDAVVTPDVDAVHVVISHR
ncbi:MAG: cytochrome P450 [Acidimicrobiia bacterium]